MKVSVIMSIYNESLDYVKQAIVSILNQSISDFHFIIVVDNPNHIEVIDYLKYMKNQDTRIQILYNEINIGLANSLNKALDECYGEYVFRMDADDIAYPKRFEKQLKFMEDNQLDICATKIALINQKGIKIRNQCTQNRHYLPRKVNQLIFYRNFLPHPTWCVKLSVYRELNKYKNLVPVEDYEFLLRAIKQNKRIGLYDDILLDYRDNALSISKTKFYEQTLKTSILQRYLKKQVEIDEYLLNKLYKEYSCKRGFSKQYFYKYMNTREEVLLKKSQIILRGLTIMKLLILSPFVRQLIINDIFFKLKK